MHKESLRSIASKVMVDVATKDEKIMLFTSDATGSCNLGEYKSKFPEKFVEMGIAEQNEITVGSGMAHCGYKVFIFAPSAFLSSRALEQVKVDVAYGNANVKIVGVSGGLSYGASGPTHYSITDISAIAPLENIKVFVPSDSIQMMQLMYQMVDIEGPCYIRIGRNPVNQIYQEKEKFEIGKAKKVTDGDDLTICAMGETVYYAVEAAKQLKESGINARVLDMFSVKPIDKDAIVTAAKETKGIIVVEEHANTLGLGSIVCQVVSKYCPTKVNCLGLPAEHLKVGTSSEMMEYYGLDTQGIIKAAKQMLK